MRIVIAALGALTLAGCARPVSCVTSVAEAVIPIEGKVMNLPQVAFAPTETSYDAGRLTMKGRFQSSSDKAVPWAAVNCKALDQAGVNLGAGSDVTVDLSPGDSVPATIYITVDRKPSTWTCRVRVD